MAGRTGRRARRTARDRGVRRSSHPSIRGHVPRSGRAGRARPAFEEEVRRFKFRGSSGKVNLAVDRLPDSRACQAPASTSAARSRSARASTRWSSVRRREVHHLQSEAVHRHDHSDPRRPVDDAARQARDQLLRPVRAVHLARSSDLDDQRERSATPSSTGSRSSPEHPRRILFRHVRRRSNIERTTGSARGTSSRRAVLEQLFFNRPVPATPAFRTADPRPLAVRIANPPGARIMGANGRSPRWSPPGARSEGRLTDGDQYNAVVSAAATTPGHGRVPREGGRRTLVHRAAGAGRRGGRDVDPRWGRVPRLAHTVAGLRRRRQGLDLRSHGLRLLAPDIASSLRSRTAGRDPLERPGADGR